MTAVVLEGPLAPLHAGAIARPDGWRQFEVDAVDSIAAVMIS